MSGTRSEIERKKQAEAAKAKTRQAMAHEAHEAAGQDSRLKHFVEQEKTELKQGAKVAEAHKDLGR